MNTEWQISLHNMLNKKAVSVLINWTVCIMSSVHINKHMTYYHSHLCYVCQNSSLAQLYCSPDLIPFSIAIYTEQAAGCKLGFFKRLLNYSNVMEF